jgi:hypothetical protein
MLAKPLIRLLVEWRKPKSTAHFFSQIPATDVSPVRNHNAMPFRWLRKQLETGLPQRVGQVAAGKSAAAGAKQPPFELGCPT